MKRSNALRKRLHDHGYHRFCHVVEKRVRTGSDFGQKWLVGSDPVTGEETRVDVTIFGGEPIYESRTVHE